MPGLIAGSRRAACGRFWGYSSIRRAEAGRMLGRCAECELEFRRLPVCRSAVCKVRQGEARRILLHHQAHWFGSLIVMATDGSLDAVACCTGMYRLYWLSGVEENDTEHGEDALSFEVFLAGAESRQSPDFLLQGRQAPFLASFIQFASVKSFNHPPLMIRRLGKSEKKKKSSQFQPTPKTRTRMLTFGGQLLVKFRTLTGTADRDRHVFSRPLQALQNSQQRSLYANIKPSLVQQVSRQAGRHFV